MTERNDPALEALAHRLQAERPVPRAAFRGDLRRRLVADDRRPVDLGRVRRLIFAYAGSGLCLLAVAAAGLAGLGPLAA